jgi:hypothetical protein
MKTFIVEFHIRYEIDDDDNPNYTARNAATYAFNCLTDRLRDGFNYDNVPITATVTCKETGVKKEIEIEG